MCILHAKENYELNWNRYNHGDTCHSLLRVDFNLSVIFYAFEEFCFERYMSLQF